MAVAEIILQIALNIALTAAVIRWHERRLSPRERARGWNAASFWSAVVVFGPLALPVHFTRTRRSLRGLIGGLAAMAGVLGVILLVMLALDVMTALVRPR